MKESANIGGFCSQIGGAMLKPQCCGICAVANQYSVADTIEGKVSKEQFVNYHLETCFKIIAHRSRSLVRLIALLVVRLLLQ